MKIPDGYVVLFHDNHGKDVDFEVKNLVLCKNCKHYWKNNVNYAGNTVEVCLVSPRDNAYCSEGKRKGS